MVAYILIYFIISFLGMILIIKPVNKDNNIIKNFFLMFSAMILILFGGLRGDFTSDYKNYEYLFNYYNSFDSNQLFSHKFGQEIGFVVLNWLIGRITDNIVLLMFLVLIIIIILYFREIRNTSSNVYLSVLLFVTVGQYFTSFNLIRQIMAASIVFCGSKYLYKRQFIKYLILVLLAALFHKTSLIMIPFYFILNIRFNYKRFFAYFATLILIGTNINTILVVIQRYFYSHYIDSFYGMSGFGYKNIILPLFIIVFVLSSKLVRKNKYDNVFNIWINSTVFFAVFSFLGIKIQLIERLSHFFAPYILLIIPKIVTSQDNKSIRIIYYYVIIMGAILYNYVILSGSGYDPYYFIWQ